MKSNAFPNHPHRRHLRPAIPLAAVTLASLLATPAFSANLNVVGHENDKMLGDVDFINGTDYSDFYQQVGGVDQGSSINDFGFVAFSSVRETGTFQVDGFFRSYRGNVGYVRDAAPLPLVEGTPSIDDLGRVIYLGTEGNFTDLIGRSDLDSDDNLLTVDDHVPGTPSGSDIFFNLDEAFAGVQLATTDRLGEVAFQTPLESAATGDVGEGIFRVDASFGDGPIYVAATGDPAPGGATFSDFDDISLYATPIPEPQHAAGLVALVAVVALFSRRRRG